MWAALAAIAGLAGTLLAYFLNPGRAKEVELKKIDKELEQLYVQRDKALEKNNSDDLTRITSRIIVLHVRKDDLLQRK